MRATAGLDCAFAPKTIGTTAVLAMALSRSRAGLNLHAFSADRADAPRLVADGGSMWSISLDATVPSFFVSAWQRRLTLRRLRPTGSRLSFLL